MRIRFFTHGTTTDNENGIASGWNDVLLSAKGVRQANQNRLDCENLNFDVVFCSGLARTHQTSEILFPDHEIIADAALNEMNYGAMNGKSLKDFSPDKFECIEQKFYNGENCLEVEARMRAFLDKVSTDYIAIISHKYPQLALDVICNGATWREAIENDWRRRGDWQLTWEYML